MTTTLTAVTDALLGLYRRAPMELVRGEGVHLYDSEGAPTSTSPPGSP